MTGRAEASDISIKQTCRALRTWAPGETQPQQKDILVPPVHTAQCCAHITFAEEMVFHQGHCTGVLYTDPALSCHFLQIRACRHAPWSSLEATLRPMHFTLTL